MLKGSSDYYENRLFDGVQQTPLQESRSKLHPEIDSHLKCPIQTWFLQKLHKFWTIWKPLVRPSPTERTHQRWFVPVKLNDMDMDSVFIVRIMFPKWTKCYRISHMGFIPMARTWLAYSIIFDQVLLIHNSLTQNAPLQRSSWLLLSYMTTWVRFNCSFVLRNAWARRCEIEWYYSKAEPGSHR